MKCRVLYPKSFSTGGALQCDTQIMVGQLVHHEMCRDCAFAGKVGRVVAGGGREGTARVAEWLTQVLIKHVLLSSLASRVERYRVKTYGTWLTKLRS